MLDVRISAGRDLHGVGWVFQIQAELFFPVIRDSIAVTVDGSGKRAIVRPAILRRQIGFLGDDFAGSAPLVCDLLEWPEDAIFVSPGLEKVVKFD